MKHQQKLRKEQERQEQIRRDNIQTSYNQIVSQIHNLCNTGGVKNIDALLKARKCVEQLQTLEKQNYWIERKSANYSQLVEQKCTETYNQLIEYGNKWADKYNNGKAKFDDVNKNVYDYYTKAYKLYPSEELKNACDLWLKQY